MTGEAQPATGEAPREVALELNGAEYADTLIVALRDFVASSPPGDCRLAVVTTGPRRRTLKFGGLIAEPDLDALKVIADEHRIVR